ncbi:SH3 domain-containing protein [Rickettsiales endosymbiont of Stachyamoeba lipophora]|uniref:SH3 domain-containing protein n=1 Tax=Rickettsiales endosymbiont of Stachyamoeba lipophora TaxID=2486578 RepID=UPI000F647946|nr:SH3 domain-containing protein [Rickettsiales endosymbiont of Stachyamoeba lipophora]AZL16221.1 hypothetical protein EF513_06735 [Rickettsiales endosymbiont of Stachyamoeba lipophora]
MIKNLFLILSAFFFIINNSIAKKDLPVPRFASIKSGHVNVRTGPNVRYPIKWVFIEKNEPIEVIAEFEQWRKIKDIEAQEGWVHESMLTGKRFAIITSSNTQIIYKNPDITSYKIVKIESKVRVRLDKCKLDWCRINVNDYQGWIKKDFLWGVYKNEEYK